MASASEVMMRHCLLVWVFAMTTSMHGGSVHGLGSYPKLVSWERTDSETFESRPNVLEGVDYITPSVVSANAKVKEEHFYTNRDLPEGKLDCVDSATRPQPELKFSRRDLPGLFLCEKTIFVIPVIEVERNRFFNVSLDFLQLSSPDPIRIFKFATLPQGLTVEVSPFGIVFVSGILRSGEGTLCLKLDFNKETGPKKVLYRIKILLNIRENEENLKQRSIEFRMVPNRKYLEGSDVKKQIEAIKCAAESVSLRPWDFHNVSPHQELAENFSLRAFAEFAEDFCAPDPEKSEHLCRDFSINKIIYNNTKCQSAPNKRSEVKPQIVTEQDTSESEESYLNDTDLGEVSIQGNELVSVPVPPTSTPAATTLPARATSPSEQNNVNQDAQQPIQPTDSTRDLDPHANDGGNPANSGNSGVRLEPIQPAVLQNEVPGRGIEDPSLKTALYGMLGLAAIVIFVIFVFLFSRLELCKKKAGYDPVYMTSLSSDSTKFA